MYIVYIFLLFLHDINYEYSLELSEMVLRYTHNLCHEKKCRKYQFFNGKLSVFTAKDYCIVHGHTFVTNCPHYHNFAIVTLKSTQMSFHRQSYQLTRDITNADEVNK